MTPTTAPRIRRWEPSAAVISFASARPVKAFYLFICFCFTFDVIYFQDLMLFVPALLGSFPLFPSTTGDCVESKQFFACPVIAWVPTMEGRGPSPG
jgi:hypothetical protein